MGWMSDAGHLGAFRFKFTREPGRDFNLCFDLPEDEGIEFMSPRER